MPIAFLIFARFGSISLTRSVRCDSAFDSDSGCDSAFISLIHEVKVNCLLIALLMYC